MARIQNAIDCAYDIAKKEFKKDASFSFHDLWKKVCHLLNFDQQKNVYSIGEFFGDMMQDVRFVRISADRWKLRETMKFEDWDKISRSMSVAKEYLEEDEEFHETENELQNEDDEIEIDDLNLNSSDLEDSENYDRYGVEEKMNDSELLLSDQTLDISDDE